MEKLIIEGVIKYKSEDGGRALIAEISDDISPMFVRLHSWEDDEDSPHKKAGEFEGKKVRVTVEVIE